MEKKQKKTKIIWIGCAVIATAILLILSVILIPRISQKNDMKELLRAVADSQSERLMLRDPLLEGENPLGNGGAEVLLNPTQISAVQNELKALLEDGFRHSGKAQEALQWDLFLQARTADGAVVQIYFTPTAFYSKAEAPVLFLPKNAEAYAEFYALLQAILTQS